ncbi:SMP-30/gluconolactonase/LRE family protein [Rhodovibrionaceae bacterium A322]
MNATPSPYQAELLIEMTSNLGEGIQWDSHQNRVRWTDIHGCKLHSCKADGSDLQTIELTERLCSFTLDADGDLLCAFASGLYLFDPESGKKDLIAAFEPDLSTTRLNDGRCDRSGRFVVGGIDEDSLRPLSSTLSFDGRNLPRPLISQVGCTNSLAFSPDGTLMYFADTAGKDIFVFDYDPATGDISNKRLFVRLGPDEGRPDGSCVDAEGRLWNAQYGGSRVQAYNPDGSLGPTIHLPCPEITCVAFGGPDLDRLYITSAQENMDQASLDRYPLSGSLFCFDAGAAFGAKGLPEERFGLKLSELPLPLS